MPYVPQNVDVYTAAFAGAMASMCNPVGAAIIDPISAHYAGLAVIADTWAQAVDTAWGSITVPNQYDLDCIQSLSAEYHVGHPDPHNTLWTIAAIALVAAVQRGDTQLAAEGITPPALPLTPLQHRISPASNNHIATSLTYADTTTQAAAVLAAGDVGRVAQVGTDNYGIAWKTPHEWYPIGQAHVFAPTGLNDATRFENFLVGHALICPGAPIQFIAGTYDWNKQVNCSAYNNLEIHLHPKTVIKASVVGASIEGLFHITGPFFEPPIVATTLAATAPVGNTTLSLVDSVTVGDYLYVQGSDGDNLHWFQVKNVAGLGPYTVTIDRPIEWAIPIGSVVEEHNWIARGFYFYGHNGTIDSSGWGSALHFLHCWNVRVDGVNIIGGANALEIVNADAGSYDVTFTDIRITGGGMGIESSERNYISNCSITNANDAMQGICLFSVANTLVENCLLNDAQITINTNGGGAGAGCKNVTVISSTINRGFAANGFGIQVANTQNLTLNGVTVDNVTAAVAQGVSIAASCTGLFSIDAALPNCGTGIAIAANCPAKIVGNVDVTGCHLGVIGNAYAELTILASGLKNSTSSLLSAGAEGGEWTFDATGIALGPTDFAINFSSGGNHKAHGRITMTTGKIYFIDNAATVLTSDAILSTTNPAPIQINNGNVNLSGSVKNGAGGTGTVIAAGVLNLHDITLDASAPGEAYLSTFGGTTRLGSGIVIVQGALNAGAGFINRGTITLNGVTPVDYSFPNLQPDPGDPVTLIRKTAGVTAQSALPPTFTKTLGAGGKVTVVSATPNANDTYEIIIG